MPFEKGKSGNPSGRPKETGERLLVKDLARKHTADAIKTLVEVCNSKSAPETARVAASNSILDRGYGRPPQAHVGEDGEGPIQLHVVNFGPPGNNPE